jgi:hypothetical protein
VPALSEVECVVKRGFGFALAFGLAQLPLAPLAYFAVTDFAFAVAVALGFRQVPTAKC